MRIRIVSEGYPPALGGIETVVHQTASALARLGDEVEVWAMRRPSGTPRDTMTDAGVRVIRFTARGSARFTVSPSLRKHVMQNAGHADIVHFHNLYSGIALASLAVPPNTPLVLSAHYHGAAHSTLARIAHIPYRPVAQRIIRRARAVVADTHSEAELLSQDFDVDRAKLSVVHFGADSASISAQDAWPDTPPTLMSLGRLEFYKNVERSIKAFITASNAGLVSADSQFVIIGVGPDLERLRALVPPTMIDRVRFLGRLPELEVGRWLNTAHALVSMSSHEAFGLVALEASAGGARTILSDIPAHQEVAQLISTAPTLIPVALGADVDPLVAAITKELTCSRSSPERVRTWDDTARDCRRIYKQLVTMTQ